MEKNTSAFLSWEFISWGKLPPVEGTRVTVPTGQVRTTALDALCPSIAPVTYGPRLSHGRQTLNGALVVRTVDLADGPAVHLY